MSGEDRARGDLAERMLPVAAQLACLVHDAGDRRGIQQALARLADGEKDALIVVLAGLVPPDVPLGQLLKYLDWDETGGHITPRRTRTTLRDIAPDYKPTLQPHYIDEVAVERALGGDPVRLNQRERNAAVVRGLVSGMETEAVAQVLRMTCDAVDRAWDRARARAREAGEPMPERPMWARAA